ncbi:acid phosphatase type 7-like [Dermacentor variabilis]|uniref:acid phosphatase type 7-like n=1 Tax=Dermacentor variabilis TaxID=34621 RepID=UPI003F5C0FA4
MRRLWLAAVIAGLVLIVCHIRIGSSAAAHTQPQQIHLSYGASENERVVTWVTFDRTSPPTVEYGLSGFQETAQGSTTRFKDGGRKKRVLYIHRVLLKDLERGTEYMYHCGSAEGWSAVYTFRVAPWDSSSATIAVFGDLGSLNARSLPALQQDTHTKKIDAVLHLGDFAYDMHSRDATVGDEFMRQIEPIAAYVPYMTAVGNHENAYNFSNYANRFSMMDKSGNFNNFFYSFDIGPAHIISYSTEFYFFLKFGWHQVPQQYDWLEKDLQEANLPENRAKRPWIITMSHRPMYCSNVRFRDCNSNTSIARKGFPLTKMYGLEKLFFKYGVDLHFTGHQHSYERLWPVYDGVVYNGTSTDPYVNPRAPVHVVTGAAGNSEFLSPFVPDPKPWSAMRISDYGFTKLHLINRTHIQLQQISTREKPRVVDAVHIVKDKPRNF